MKLPIPTRRPACPRCGRPADGLAHDPWYPGYPDDLPALRIEHDNAEPCAINLNERDAVINEYRRLNA